LEESRRLLKNINVDNFGQVANALKGLLEETQMYGNRIEAALYYHQDLTKLHDKRKKLKEEIKKLKSERESYGKPELRDEEKLLASLDSDRLHWADREEYLFSDIDLNNDDWLDSCVTRNEINEVLREVEDWELAESTGRIIK